MNPQAIHWIMPVGATVYVFLAAAIIVTRSSNKRGAAHWVMLAMAGWIIGGMIEWVAQSPDGLVVGRMVTDISTALLPPFIFVAVCFFSATRCPRWAKLLAFAIPIITICLAVTHPWHDLMWAPTFANGEVIRLEHSQWFNQVHLPHAVLLSMIDMVLMCRRAFAVTGNQRALTGALTVTFFVPVAATVAHYFNAFDMALSPAPVLAAITAPVVGWLILRRGALIDNTLQYRHLFERMQDAVFVVDQDLKLLSCNPAGAKMLDTEPEAIDGRHLESVLPDVVPIVIGKRSCNDISLGERRLSVQVSRLERGLQLSNAVIVCRDVTNEWAARTALMRSEELLSSLVHHSSNAILRLRQVTLEDGRIDYNVLVANPIAAEFFNTTAEAMIGSSLGQFVPESVFVDTGAAQHAIGETLGKAVAEGVSEQLEFSLNTDSGLRWYRLMADPVGSDIGVVCFDITRQREQKIRLETEAFQDALTGVLNRRGFERLASQCLASQDDDVTGALLFVDLNDFKRVNDDYGHDYGDYVLRQLGKRLHDVTGDGHILGRIGGDEFVVLATNLDKRDAKALQKALHTALAEPYKFNGETLTTTASVGMARFPEHGVTLTTLMRYADAAMYGNKAATRSDGATHGYRIVK
ncbi:MAG: diguanylate cyclase [Pseudomonadota bacterium]